MRPISLLVSLVVVVSLGEALICNNQLGNWNFPNACNPEYDVCMHVSNHFTLIRSCTTRKNCEAWAYSKQFPLDVYICCTTDYCN